MNFLLLFLSCWVKFTSPAVNITYVRFTMLYLQNFELDPKWREWNIHSILINFDHSHSLSGFTASLQPLVFIESIQPPYPLSSLSWRMQTILDPCDVTVLWRLRPNPPPPHTHPTPHISISPSLVLSFTLFSMRLYFWARQCSYKHWTRTSMSLGGRCWCHDDDAESSLCFLSVSASLSCQCVWGREWLWEGIHQLPSSLHQTLCSKFVCPCICVCSFTSMGINWL